MKKRKDKLISVYLMFGLILLVIGFSYAFFIYNKTGLYTHTITGGKMKVIYDELAGNNIVIENAYPLTDEEALTKSLEFEFAITGYNESDKNIYYAIEIDHGEDVNGKTRFLDSDMKLTLYENEKLIFENEIYDNLDNQDIYYGYINAGTSSENPTINNYKMNIWINDNVIISDTLPDDFTELNDGYLEFILSKFNISNELDLYELMEKYCPGLFEGTSTECPFSNFGLNIYSSDEFANSYANFKVNIRADLTYKDVNYLTYDSNGGTFNVEKSSLLTNRVTIAKPVKGGKAFVGWSSNPEDTIPEYYAGDHYNGDGEVLYAIYNDEINMMTTFPELIIQSEQGPTDMSYENYKAKDINYIVFMREEIEIINERYNEALIKADVTYDEYGYVRCWVEPYEHDESLNVLYVASPGVIYLTDCRYLFESFENCTWIDLTNVDTSLVTDMTGMFALRDAFVEPSSYNKSKKSFEKLSTITQIASMADENGVWFDLTALNTSNVISMENMFSSLNAIELDFSKFDISNVINMKSMFSGASCRDLIVDEKIFNTKNVENFESMFAGSDLASYRKIIENLDFSSAINVINLFRYAESIDYLSLSNWNTTNLTDMSYMFSGASIYVLDLSSLDTSNVTNMASMFEWSSIKILLLDNLDVSDVVDMSNMFYSCHDLINISFKNWDVSKVENMSRMFYHCMNLQSLDLDIWKATSVTDMTRMFQYCFELTNIDLSDFLTAKVTDVSNLFNECRKLLNVDLSGLNSNNLINMNQMFYKCKK